MTVGGLKITFGWNSRVAHAECKVSTSYYELGRGLVYELSSKLMVPPVSTS